MEFPIPASPKVYTKTITDFLGVDFTSISPSNRRATNMVNLINNDGYLETRPGYVRVFPDALTTGNTINGVWNIDKDGTNIFVVHITDKLYTLDEIFENLTEITLSETMNNVVSRGLYLNNKLVIFDGKRTIIYAKFDTTWEAKYLDTIGYVPTTVIARKPDGTGGTKYEEINFVQPYRINSFLSDGASATYKVELPFDDEQPTATILQSDGTIAEFTILSFDRLEGTVTFATIPPVSPVTGRDNIFIRFKVTNEETISYINKSTIIESYGYNGNNNRIFCTGNPDFPNVDWFCEVDDATYFPAENYRRVGFEPIQNYLRLNDGSLAMQKKISDTDATIYYTKSALYNGKEVFPIERGVKSIGCISKYANSNLINDPLTLTELGIYAVVGSNYDENFSKERGFFIKNKLLNEANLENATAISFKGKYYLAINNHVYIADSRYTSAVREANNSNFQYEWYYWENVPVKIWFTYNNELYFGTQNGSIMKFDDNLIVDSNINDVTLTTSISQLFDTSFLDLSSITQAKTVKRVTIVSRPFEETEFKLSYVTNEEVTDITTRNYEQGDFPSTLQEKEKIKKIMFVKFRLSGVNGKKMNFYQMAIEYVFAGHYRG